MIPIVLKLLLVSMPFLQAGLIKNIVKGASQAGKVVKPGSKMSKASKILIADDLLAIEQGVQKTEYSKNLAAAEEQLMKAGSNASKQRANLSSLKKQKKKIEDEMSRAVKEKIEDAIKEYLFENLTRDNVVWDYSVLQLLQDPFFPEVKNYIRGKYGVSFTEKADIYLLLHEKKIHSLKLSRKAICHILSRFSLSYKITSINYLKQELEEHKPIIDRLEHYIKQERSIWRKRKRR